MLAALGAAGALYLSRENDKDNATDAQPARTQRTLLVQIRGAQRTALASALVATDPATARASVTLLPSRIITEVPGFGDSMLGKGLALGGPDLAAETAANLLGVMVDGTWTVSPEGLAGLIDAIGGVTAEVDVEVKTTGAGGVTIEPGTHLLTGLEAAAFATYQGPEERELAKLPRMQAVLMAVVKAMPPTAATLLPSAGSESSIDPAPLAEQLRLLAAAESTAAVSYAVLPVSELEFGGDEVTYKLETAEAQALVESNLAASVPESAFGRSNRVLVQNGVGTAAITRTVTKKLLPAGFRVVDSGNADSFTHQKTVVLVFDDSAESIAVGERVAEVLGLPAEAVQISTIAQTTADVIVIVGADYRP
ncbi:MAG TPA: LCP family protein [Mycobacteriales bacterium]|nr:LCP family protein [Mycobacteriales bacterium]